MTLKLEKFGISSLAHTFDNFKVTAGTQTAYSLMKSITKDSDIKFILLYGLTGTGKTHLIEALIIEWAKLGIFSRYQTFSDIMRYLKSGIKTPELYEERFKRLAGMERLIIDDYGMGTMESRFEISDLEDIIDLRYRKRYYPDNKMVTILSSNKDIKELPDRIVSRFYDPEFGRVIHTGDMDYRKRRVK